MSYNYRCSNRRDCGASKTLKRPIETYIKKKLCPSCGEDRLKTVDSREKKRNKERVCKCDGYHYPHRRGTEPWCNHAKIGPDDNDYGDRHGR